MPTDRPALLPIQVPPRLGETTDSYIRRLARANHLKPSYLHRFLCGPPFWFGKPSLSRLAAASGRPRRSLERALADVASPRRRNKPNVRYPSTIPLADRPDLALRLRETAQSGTGPSVTCPDATNCPPRPSAPSWKCQRRAPAGPGKVPGRGSQPDGPPPRSTTQHEP
ncbi:TniQ family protein [Streptomyces sp. NPDC005393]|uniref:TniQ family protein n=1 Tax=Streptomyces sp. NPDC005393 TaxID=3157041 RepID=UPI0033B9401F